MITKPTDVTIWYRKPTKAFGLAIDLKRYFNKEQRWDKDMVGCDPHDYRIVVVKSANHLRAGWTDVASEIIDSDPPGIGSNDLSAFVFKRQTRKVYPLDKDAVYPE